MATMTESALIQEPKSTVDTMKAPTRKDEKGTEPLTWPFEAGFKTDYEEKTPVELEVTGTIPAYAAGVLYRTGPGNYQVKTKKGDTFEAHHWFDGFTTVHRFEIREDAAGTKVFYNSRRTVDELIERIRETGSTDEFSFGQKKDPCQGLFKKVMSTFKAAAAQSSKGPITHQNIGVTLSANMPSLKPAVPRAQGHRVESLITKTDAGFYQHLDPETLEPAGVCRQSVLHPDLKGPLSAAHAKTCPITGDVYNYNLEIAATSTYRIFCASAFTGKTTILATIPSIGAYLHSLFLTPSTVVLCVWNSHYAQRGISLLLNKNVLDSIAPMNPSLPATWYVIDRTPSCRGVIATYISSAFFAFHSTNAYEVSSPTTPGSVDIVAEIATYADLDVLHRFYYSYLLPSNPATLSYRFAHPKCLPRLTRFRLPGVPVGMSAPKQTKPAKAGIDFELPTALAPELPTIDPRRATLPHRYVYGVRDTGTSGYFDGLMKLDTQTQTAVYWTEHAQTAGEPIFVPARQERAQEGEEDEDEGVLLSVVLDGIEGRSYLLCLDAKTMKEAGRASVKGVVGFGFHGLHVPREKGAVYSGGD